MKPDPNSLLLRRTCLNSVRARFPTLTTRIRITCKRRTSTVPENKVRENQKSYIELGENEKLLFLTNILRVGRTRFDARQKELKKSEKLEKSISEYCIPRSVEVEIDDAKTEDAKAKAPQTKASEASDTITNTKTKATRSIKVVEVLPRVRDGGAFVKYHSEEQDIRQVHSGIKKYLKENPVRFLWIPFCLPVKLFSYRPIKWLDHYIVKPVTVHPVLGKPLLEDMDRFPSTALKVEFVNSMEEGHPGKWDQEKIFSVFREYGKIADIIPQAAPGEDSDMPKSAVVWFRKIRSATAAKNCLQGYEIDYKGKTESLRVLYRRRLKVRVIRVWLFNQPKFTIPVLALLVASIVVWLFDPVRVWSIEAKITDSYTLQLTATAKQFWRFICRQVRGYMSPIFGMGNANQRRKDGNMGKQSSDEQGTDEQKTSKHVSELSDGNEIEVESLRRLLKGDRTTVVYHGPRPGQLGLILRDVVFDRKHILVIDCKPIAEASTGSAGAERLAKQVGYWPLFSFFSQLYGLLLGATIGSDGGAESAAETTLDEILRATRIAVKNVALREKDPKSLLSDDEYLHKCSPLKRPVVIFDNFSHNEDDRLIYEKLVDCAHQLMSEKHATVIILTNDDDFYKSFPDTLYDRMMLDGPMTSGLTSGCENAVKHLQRTKIITVESEGGIIKQSRPREEAFSVWTGDKDLVKRINLQTYIAKCELKSEHIKRWEMELARLVGVPTPQKQEERKKLEERQTFLWTKIFEAHKAIEGNDKKMKKLRDDLAGEA